MPYQWRIRGPANSKILNITLRMKACIAVLRYIVLPLKNWMMVIPMGSRWASLIHVGMNIDHEKLNLCVYSRVSCHRLWTPKRARRQNRENGQTDTHTDTQDNYQNPRACAPRVTIAHTSAPCTSTPPKVELGKELKGGMAQSEGIHTQHLRPGLPI